MTASAPTRKRRNSLLGVVAGLCAVGAFACAPRYVEIPIETPIQPKLDVSAFQRVLVAGFVAGGTEDVDANQETTRLLRSQLRSKSQLTVIDSDVMSLADIAQNQNRAANDAAASGTTRPSTDQAAAGQTLPTPIKDEKDIEPYERLFANTAYWKQIGEEFQNPLIVTGTVLFMERTASNVQVRQNERLDAFGRRQVDEDRVLMDRKAYVLRQNLVFIDGRTGATLHSELRTEQIVYGSQQNMPALSSYFELMDKLVPEFLSSLSSQKIRGTRVLLK